jgi:CRISPR/Cas system-associated protein endoribonuclease Cas2
MFLLINIMGNSKSNQQNSETINVNHPYFGDIQVIEHEGEKYMKIKMLTEGEKAIS